MEHISLDGVIQHSADDDDFPYSDWSAPYRTPAGRDLVLSGSSGTLIRARQLEPHAVRCHPQCVQGRGAFVDRIIRRLTVTFRVRRRCVYLI